MKKIILACALFITFFSNAQIKVIETTPIIRLGSIGQNDMFILTEGNKFEIGIDCFKAQDLNFS